MTRVNTVPVSELHRVMLLAENKEIVRLFSLSRKFPDSRLKEIPKQYVLGTGHCLFFVDKLGYILNRYHSLTAELRARGYSPNPIPDEELIKGIDSSRFRDYTPTQEAIKLNRDRINERLSTYLQKQEKRI